MTVAKLRTPIVLVHGLLGFDEIKVCGKTVATYFPGIAESLRDAGNRVFIARLSKTRGVADRASELKRFIQQHSPAEPVHILAHSMGGLDARYMISCLDMAPRVLSLTTIGTPHRGTSFADWGVQRLERFLRPLFEMFGIPGQAFYDLTTWNCARFNEEVPDAPGVRYFSVAGKHEQTWRSLRWKILHDIVERAEGPNDGVVAMSSATYGEDTEVWDGDHLTLVNWPDQAGDQWEDRTPRYGQLVCRLADIGF
jgi:triacylglycerol lipase